VQFKDFLEPHVIKTGHLIPVSAGHNGCLSQTELTLYEIHLTNADFIQDFAEPAPGEAESSAQRPDSPFERAGVVDQPGL
jgi:hypothetical protein